MRPSRQFGELQLLQGSAYTAALYSTVDCSGRLGSGFLVQVVPLRVGVLQLYYLSESGWYRRNTIMVTLIAAAAQAVA